jgi:ankyrin repeat domain-containing protein 17
MTSLITNSKMDNPFIFSSFRHPADRDDFEATGNETYSTIKGKKHGNNVFDVDNCTSNAIKLINNSSPKICGKRDEGWKEVVRK